jgi:CRP-like cAMP-binding protein
MRNAGTLKTQHKYFEVYFKSIYICQSVWQTSTRLARLACAVATLVQVAFAQGEEVSAACVVLSGRVDVRLRSSAGHVVTIDTLTEVSM